MDLKKFYDNLSSKEQYRLVDRKNIQIPKFPRSLFAFENRFNVVIPKIETEIAEAKTKLTIIDIGCGDGIYEKYLSKSALNKVNIIGIDFSKKQLSKAKRYFNKTYCVDLDSKKTPLKSNSADLIICSEVLEHVFFPEKTIAEISRILKPGGHLIFTTPNVASLQTRLSLLVSGFSPMLNYIKNKEHIRFYSLVDLRELFLPDLKIVEERGIGSCLFAPWNATFKLPLPRILQLIGDRFFPNLANGFLIVARKK